MSFRSRSYVVGVFFGGVGSRVCGTGCRVHEGRFDVTSLMRRVAGGEDPNVWEDSWNVGSTSGDLQGLAIPRLESVH